MSTQDHTFDLIICGAGSSGLGLAYHLSRQKHQLRIALIDSNFSQSENKTWCFWDYTSIPEKQSIHHSWSRLSVQNQDISIEQSITAHEYYCIRNADYRSTMLSLLKNDSRISIIEDKIIKICEDENSRKITVSLLNHSEIKGLKTFDSTRKNWQSYVQTGSNFLLQHFEGWEIETNVDCFDPSTAKLMDFRTSQEFGFAFVYVLPFSKNRALVELTYFSEQVPASSHYAMLIQKYLSDHYNLVLQDSNGTGNSSAIRYYQILNTETGVIPMIDLPFKSVDTGLKFNIGLQGGLAKPSTGYAFTRIQWDVRQIAANLINGNVIKRIKSPFRFRFYDMLILHIIRENPKKAQQIFIELFQKNGFDTMFKFLDEKTSFTQDLKIMASVPSYLDFFKAIAKTLPKIAKL